MIFTRDFVTRENYWQIASLMTQKSLFTVTHALFFISINTFCDISFVCIFLCFISVFCYGPRDGKGTCNAKDGNPFGPFWDTFNIDFDDSQFYKGMSIDTLVKGAPEQWNKK